MSDTSFDDIGSQGHDTGSRFGDIESQFDDIRSELDGLSFSESPTPLPDTPPLTPVSPVESKTLTEELPAFLLVATQPKMATDNPPKDPPALVTSSVEGDKQVDPVDRAAQALRNAAAGGYVSLVELLLKKYMAKYPEKFIDRILNGADKDDASPLFHAAFVGHANVVEVLLAQEGINVNQKNGKDWTPLRAALGNDNADAAELLAEHTGVKVTKKFHKNWNPLCHAAAAGYIHVVKLILERGDKDPLNNIKVELDEVDGDGMTALYLAASGGHLRVVKCLLASGAKVNQDSKGYLMPLYGAAAAGHSRIVEILLQHQADPKARTLEGDSALDAAVKQGHTAAADLLMEQP